MGSSEDKTSSLLFAFVVMFGGGCEAPVEDMANEEPDVEVALPVVEEEVIAQEVNSNFSWVVVVEGTSFAQDANVNTTCRMEKEGQLYISGTHLGGGDVTVSVRLSIPDSLPAEVPVMGLFEGQDASVGEALASLKGGLFGLSNRVFYSVEGTLMLEEIENCVGSFDLTFKMDDGTAVEVRDAMFEMPFEENRL